MLWFCTAYHTGFIKQTKKHDATKLKEVPQNSVRNVMQKLLAYFRSKTAQNKGYI
jgi:hypothetical protein